MVPPYVFFISKGTNKEITKILSTIYCEESFFGFAKFK